jgi:DNA-binding MarR family transcriptional regulator/N-acetylglutamate synthase-like GNAT family acetyltransferase
MNFYRQVGVLIFGTRLKRLSDRFLTDVDKVYKTLNVDFEISWFPFFYLLKEKMEMSVTEIANELNITHSAVSQFVTALEKKKIVRFLKDRNDKRRRLICFTPKGLDILNSILPVWESIVRGMESVCHEGENSSHIIPALNEIEDALDRESLHARIISDYRRSQFGKVEIVQYEPQIKKPYKALILNWLIEIDDDEKINIELINHPEKKVSMDEGKIYMAMVNDEIIGTIAMTINNNDCTAEISYIVVDEHWRRRYIGTKLLKHGIEELKKTDFKKAFVKINRRSTNAIKLFKNSGFVLKKVAYENDSTVTQTQLLMELQITQGKK